MIYLSFYNPEKKIQDEKSYNSRYAGRYHKETLKQGESFLTKLHLPQNNRVYAYPFNANRKID